MRAAEDSAQGPKRVLISFRFADFKAEGHLSGNGVAAQRRNIKRVQETVAGRHFATGEAFDVHYFTTIPAVSLRATPGLLRKLALDPEVERIDDDVELTPALNSSVPLVGAPAAWNAGYSGAGQVIAISEAVSKRRIRFWRARWSAKHAFPRKDLESHRYVQDRPFSATSRAAV